MARRSGGRRALAAARVVLGSARVAFGLSLSSVPGGLMIRLPIAIRARIGRASSAFPLRLRDSALSRRCALIFSVREGEQFARVAKLLVEFALALV